MLTIAAALVVFVSKVFALDIALNLLRRGFSSLSKESDCSQKRRETTNFVASDAYRKVRRVAEDRLRRLQGGTSAVKRRKASLKKSRVAMTLGLLCLACAKKDAATPAVAENLEGLPAGPKSAAHSPENKSGPSPEDQGSASTGKEPGLGDQPYPLADDEPPERVWGRADLDPENDSVVAPPDPVPDCHKRLTDLGVVFSAADLPLKQIHSDIPTCGSHDAVLYKSGPLGVSVRPPAVMTCQMALGLAAFEPIVQSLASAHFGTRVRSLHQGGTYSCRKMARFDLVSEHSYGNAIDVYAFTLEDGRKVSVLSHYGKLDASPATPEARFLRQLGNRAFDGEFFSVALSPYWDALHKDHFHFDMARYRVDGTRPH